MRLPDNSVFLSGSGVPLSPRKNSRRFWRECVLDALQSFKDEAIFIFVFIFDFSLKTRLAAREHKDSLAGCSFFGKSRRKTRGIMSPIHRQKAVGQ